MTIKWGAETVTEIELEQIKIHNKGMVTVTETDATYTSNGHKSL